MSSGKKSTTGAGFAAAIAFSALILYLDSRDD